MPLRGGAWLTGAASVSPSAHSRPRCCRPRRKRRRSPDSFALAGPLRWVKPHTPPATRHLPRVEYKYKYLLESPYKIQIHVQFGVWRAEHTPRCYTRTVLPTLLANATRRLPLVTAASCLLRPCATPCARTNMCSGGPCVWRHAQYVHAALHQLRRSRACLHSRVATVPRPSRSPKHAQPSHKPGPATASRATTAHSHRRMCLTP